MLIKLRTILGEKPVSALTSSEIQQTESDKQTESHSDGTGGVTIYFPFGYAYFLPAFTLASPLEC